MFHVESNYQKCSVCSKFADDGGLKNSKFVCHDCLDKCDSERTCSECGAKMYEGYTICDGLEYYCSDDCLHTNYSREEFMDMYDNGDSYWTQW